MSDPSRPVRRGALLILLIGLTWLVAAAATVVATGVDPAVLGIGALLQYLAGIVLRTAPALAIVIAATELIRRTTGGGAATLAELEERTAAADAAGAAVRDRLLDIDATLAAIGGRLEAIHATAGERGIRLVDAARAIEGAGATLTATAATTTAAARDLAGVLPAAQHHADALAATLATTGGETARQLGDVETMLAGVFTRQDEITAQVAEIAAATRVAAAAIDGRTGSLQEAVDAALTRTAAALDQIRDGVDAQAATMLASLDAARTGLDAIGRPVATVAARLDDMVAATATIGDGLADHDARTAALVAGIERSFTVLDKRLGHATAMGTATLDAFNTRMTLVRDAADAIPPRLDAAKAMLAEVEAGTARLAPAAVEAEGLARALAQVGRPAATLTADLGRARAELAAVEEAAHGSVLAAATQLIEVLGRVRDVAGSAAGTLREALAEVVAEAETALADSGARMAAAAFADPIRREIAGLEGAATLAGEAAQATAERMAARLLGLTATVATVERRLAAVERQAAPLPLP